MSNRTKKLMQAYEERSSRLNEKEKGFTKKIKDVNKI